MSQYNVIFQDVQIINSNIGPHTYVQRRSTISNTKIGKFCSIASNVSIGPGIHKLNGISTHPALYLKDTPLIKKFSNEDGFSSYRETIIGNDVWIGEKVIILDGIIIGTGAVIAAGAVVTKDVAPYAIVGGIPAKLIKFRFSELEIHLILKSKWWDKPDEWIAKNYKDFNNISSFVKLLNEELF